MNCTVDNLGDVHVVRRLCILVLVHTVSYALSTNVDLYVGHAHLWYHVPYRSIENVWGMATKVSIYKPCAR